MFKSLRDLGVKVSVFLDWGSHPIALGTSCDYVVKEMRIRRCNSRGTDEEWYELLFLVERD